MCYYQKEKDCYKTNTVPNKLISWRWCQNR